jgi:hypothetical protein
MIFARLKRIEGLLAEMLINEREGLQIIRSRRIEIALQDSEARKPFKCPWLGCEVVPYHVHTIAEPHST